MAQAAVIEHQLTRNTIGEQHLGNDFTVAEKPLAQFSLPIKRFTTPRLANDSVQNEAIESVGQLISSERNSKINFLSVEDIKENHFVELMMLAISMGLESEVMRLLDERDPVVNVRCIMEQITNRLLSAVKAETDAFSAHAISELVQLLNKNGHNIDESMLSTMHKAIFSEEFENLHVGINRSDNNNFEDYNDINLSLSSGDMSCLLLRSTQSDFWHTVRYSILQGSRYAFMRADIEDLLYLAGHYSEEMDDLIAELTKYKPDIDVVKKIIRDDEESWYVYGLEEVDEDDFETTLTESAEYLLSLTDYYRIPLEQNYLSEWFSTMFVAPEREVEALERVSYGYPLHVLTSGNDLVNDLNQQGDVLYEESECRFILCPEHALKTLVTIARNRSLVALYDALTYLGDEAELTQKFINSYRIVEHPTKVFE